MPYTMVQLNEFSSDDNSVSLPVFSLDFNNKFIREEIELHDWVLKINNLTPLTRAHQLEILQTALLRAKRWPEGDGQEACRALVAPILERPVAPLSGINVVDLVEDSLAEKRALLSFCIESGVAVWIGYLRGSGVEVGTVQQVGAAIWSGNIEMAKILFANRTQSFNPADVLENGQTLLHLLTMKRDFDFLKEIKDGYPIEFDLAVRHADVYGKIPIAYTDASDLTEAPLRKLLMTPISNPFPDDELLLTDVTAGGGGGGSAAPASATAFAAVSRKPAQKRGRDNGLGGRDDGLGGRDDGLGGRDDGLGGRDDGLGGNDKRHCGP